MIFGRTRNLGSVLVADDEPGVRMLIDAVLTLDGHHVLLAADGQQACDILAATPSIGLAVLDLVMPKKEGIETIREIRQTHPELKIVAISGAFGGQCLDVARHLGADAVIAKPIELSVLRETVMSLLREGQDPLQSCE